MVTYDHNPSSWEGGGGRRILANRCYTELEASQACLYTTPAQTQERLFHSWFRKPNSYEHGTSTCSPGDLRCQVRAS